MPVDALISFHYGRKDKMMQTLVDCGRLRLIGDSGAFSALTSGHPIQMPEYVEWCKQWGPYLAWFAALDVIGDPVATLANFRHMRDRHQLVCVPTLHVGTDPQWMDTYVADGVDFFGLGGMVGRSIPSLPWVVKVFRYARDRHPQVRFHLWGITHQPFLRNLPAYSADSSGPMTQTLRYAELALFDPRDGQSHHVTLKYGQTRGAFKLGGLLRQVYGVTPEDVVNPGLANRGLLIRLTVESVQLQARWCQRRHQVSPPTWGLRTPRHIGETAAAGTGTRIHTVSSSVRDLLLAAGIQREGQP